MSHDRETFDLAELAERAGVTPRTVRYYIQQGLLSPPALPAPAPPRVMLPAAAPDHHPAPKPAERSQWERITLAADVELHVRRPLTREQNRLVEQLLEAARKLFEEEVP